MFTRRSYAPVLWLSILGQEANDILRLCTSFSHKRSQKKAAETTFTFRNDDRVKRLLEDVRTFPNQTWRFRYGMLGDESRILTGVIREVSPTYADKRTVQIKLFDGLMDMALRSQSKNWGKVTSTYIAQQIAKLNGFEYITEDSKDTPKKAFIQPGDVNDYQFLRDLADAIDFELFMDGEFLVYRKKPYDAAPVGTLTYYDDTTHRGFVKSFKPKVKSLGPVKSGAASTDKKKTTADGKGGTGGAQALAPYAVEQGRKGRQALVKNSQKDQGVTKPAPSGANVGGMANAARQQMLDGCNEASSEHPLTASIKPGSTWIWAGLDKGLNGKWYADSVDDELSGTSQSTKVTWKRNSRNAGSKDDKKNPNSNTKPDPKASVEQGKGGRQVVVTK